MLAAITLATSAEAQRLDDSECRNGLYHIEDGFSSAIHYGVVFDSDQKTYCAVTSDGRACLTGSELYRSNQALKKRYDLFDAGVQRMALVPELVGGAANACRRNPDGSYTLGIALERGYQTKSDEIVTSMMIGTFRFFPLANGNVTITRITTYGKEAEPEELAGIDPFARPEYLFDRRNGNPRTRFNRSTMAGGAYDTAKSREMWEKYPKGSGAGSRGAVKARAPASAQDVVTISRSGSGLAASRSAASNRARSNALSAARTACRSQGGTVVSQNTRPAPTDKATDRSYRGNATATVRCRK